MTQLMGHGETAKEERAGNLACQYMPGSLSWRMQEDCVDFKARRGCIERPWLKQKLKSERYQGLNSLFRLENDGSRYDVTEEERQRLLEQFRYYWLLLGSPLT